MEGWWKRPRTALWLIIGLTVLIYANAMNNSFHYDDYHSIRNNSSIRSLTSIPLYFISGSASSESPWGTNYRPLLYLTYVLNYALGGYTPWGYHLVNLTFHLLSISILYMIVRRLTCKSDVAFLAGLIFALHPMNTEAINYITARSTVMSSCFMLLSLLCFIIYRSSSADSLPDAANVTWKQRRAWPYYLGSLLALALALLTKETAVILPALFILYDICFFRPVLRRSIRIALIAYLPLLAAFVLCLWIRAQVLGGTLISLPIEKAYTAFLTTLKIFTVYISMMIWPFPLTIDHNLAPIRSFTDEGAILSIVLASGLALTGWMLFKSCRLISFCIFWFLLVLSPLAILPFITNVALFQENRGYMAVMAFSIALAWGIGAERKRKAGGSEQGAGKEAEGSNQLSLRTRLRRVKQSLMNSMDCFVARFPRTPRNDRSFINFVLPRLKWGLLCLVLIGYVAIDVNRNRIWADDLTLWSDAVKKSPYSTTSHYNLGLAYQKAGRWEDSIKKIQMVIKTDPSYPRAHYNLGLAYAMTGQWNMAEAAYREAIRLNPRDYKAQYNLALLYEQQGEVGLALEAYEQVLKIDPKNARAYNNIGWIYQQKGDIDAAIQAYRAALDLEPGYIKARYNLVLSYNELGNFQSALRELQLALEFVPDSAKAHYQLGRIYERLAQRDLAIAEYQKALKLEASFDDAQLRLSGLLEAMGQPSTPSPSALPLVGGEPAGRRQGLR